MMNKMQNKWDQLTVYVQNAQSIQVDPHCFGWIAVNDGDSLATVDNIQLKGFPPGHPELTGESVGVVHPLAFPLVKKVLVVTFNGGTVNKVKITQLINY